MRQGYERQRGPAGAPATPGAAPGSPGVPAIVPGPYGALRPSDRAFRKLVEHIPAIVYVETDEHPSPTAYLNPRIQQVLGYSPEEFLADWSLWRTLIHPDDRAQAEKVNRRSDRTKEPFICEYRLRARDGRYVWFHDEALFVEGEHGGPDYWQGVMIDITERKRAEREERDAAAKFRTLVDQIPAVVYIEGDDGSVDSPFYVSPQYERLFGYSASERVADPDLWSKLLHPEDREPALEAARRAADTGDPFSMDYRMIARDGRVIWVHDETVLVRDDDGNPLFWQGVLFDITDRKRVEGELHEAATRFQTLVEQIPAITYIDPLEKEPVEPLYLSPQIGTILGYPAERALRDPEWWVNLVHPEDRTRALEESNRADDSGQPYRSEYRMMAADGREVWVRDESTLVRDEAGAPQYWQGVMYDITAWKKAEIEMQRGLELARVAADELRQADDIKNTFLQAVSHDLRSPLTAMLGSALTLENEDQLGLSPETRRELIRSLARKTRKLTGIVTDLLDLERLTRGLVEPGRTDTDIGKLVARVVADSELLGDRAVSVDVQPAPIAVDRSMVERIVENLLANAAKHTAAEAMVWVRVRPERDGVLIAVEDDGSGVPEELRESLFAAFERGPSANPDAVGSGLGLSLVARFAALHGGRAWVEEREGGGASFRVFLPHAPQPDPSPEASDGQ